MGLRTTLLLCAVAAVLSAVLWLTKERPDEHGSVAVPVLGGGSLDRAVKIRWVFAGQQPVEIRRRPGDVFRIVEPVEDLASLAQLRSIAAAYDRQMNEAPLADDAATRRRLGLEEPQLVVEVEFEDGGAQRLEIGAEGPLGNDLFVRRGGRIYRGEKVLLTALQLGIVDLRERTAFRTPRELCTELLVDRLRDDGGREALHLLRGDGGEWRLLSPIQARADRGAAESLVAQVVGLRIDAFPPAVRFYDRPADFVVTLRGGAHDETARFWLTEDQHLLGRLEPRNTTIVVQNQQYLQVFENAVDRLRSRVLVGTVGVHQELVSVIVDYGPDRPRLVLSRSTPELPWAMAEPVAGAVQPTPVQQLLTAINNLRAIEFHAGSADEPRFGLRSDGLKVGTRAMTEQKPSFVRLGADHMQGQHEATYAARAEAMAEVASVPRGAALVIRRPWTDYVGLQIVDLVHSVQRLELQRRGGSSPADRRTYVLGDDGWRLLDGGVRDEIGDIVDELRDLRGKRARLLRDEQLGEPDWIVALCRDNGDRFVELAVWDRGETAPLLVQNRQAQGGLVFELSLSPHSDMLRKLWR